MLQFKKYRIPLWTSSNRTCKDSAILSPFVFSFEIRRKFYEKIKNFCSFFLWSFPNVTLTLFFSLRPKKVVLLPEICLVKIFYHLTARISQCMWEYIFFVSRKHTHKQKNFHWQIYSYEFTFFPLQKIKDRALCFSTKKIAVRVVF